jgi:predicted transcriptional regulator
MAITKKQQALLDQCHDGEMTTLELATSLDRSHESIARLVRLLEKGGWVEILSTRRRKVNIIRSGGRHAQKYVNNSLFRLTSAGLSQHSPPEGWPDER